MKTILIVEDEYAIAQMLSEVLDEEGYRVVTAANGREGLECLARERPDLILCDVMMPVMDGRELYRQVRMIPQYNSIPFVLMSAVPKLLSEGDSYDAFLSKPLNLDHLIDTIWPLINR
ncbi:MAG: response regulator [Ardenticatenales bacterium]|nr:response regulator [Ardenticatenales bacterium]